MCEPNNIRQKPIPDPPPTSLLKNRIIQGTSLMEDGFDKKTITDNIAISTATVKYLLMFIETMYMKRIDDSNKIEQNKRVGLIVFREHINMMLETAEKLRLEFE